jgi:hypothetical protein
MTLNVLGAASTCCSRGHHTLDHVRTLGVAVLPICPFVQAWMARHPEYVDLDYRSPASRVTD